jgi:type I restriction enzyme M protein
MKNLPTELRAFDDVFNSLSRKNGYYNVWEDFLTLYINSWSLNFEFERELIQKRYTLEERQKFTVLIMEVLKVLQQKISSDKCWYDFFGSFYEQVSLTKEKGFAQYFTPPTICTLMAQLLGDKDKKNLNDPACGSARMSLAANSANLGMFHALIDIDYTCAKMAALNLMLHGIKGIVICDDGLFPGNSFRGAFIINSELNYTGVPHIIFEKDVAKAYHYIRINTYSAEDLKDFFRKTEKKPPEEKESFEDIQLIFNRDTGQTSLF